MDNGDDDAIGGDLAKPWGKKKKKRNPHVFTLAANGIGPGECIEGKF